ncbi:MAG: hypothetical protein EZS28_039031 [Streblomastix strix]|uniref:ATPase AAA-type core domain-containing protein n=1 Tax=Streblomastix strix TaxID=222440 RepID=A0A5J4U661_9EUKA|nr:MAG: hypothetical protein EZS28_039031 [Streblomastix strix]
MNPVLVCGRRRQSSFERSFNQIIIRGLEQNLGQLSQQKESEQEINERIENIKKRRIELKKKFDDCKIKRESLGLLYKIVHWDDIIEQDQIKNFLKSYLELGRHIHMHFTGPPGNGKKTMAMAYATEDNLHFIPISLKFIAGEKDEDYAENIAIAFEQAKIFAPSVLFIEGIDKMIGDGTSDRAKLIMNELEKHLNKLDTSIIATSTDYSQLPEQFMNHFTLHVYFIQPLKEERFRFFTKFVQQLKLEVQQSEIDQMVIQTHGFSYQNLIEMTEMFSKVGQSEITVENILEQIQSLQQIIKQTIEEEKEENEEQNKKEVKEEKEEK